MSWKRIQPRPALRATSLNRFVGGKKWSPSLAGKVSRFSKDKIYIKTWDVVRDEAVRKNHLQYEFFRGRAPEKDPRLEEADQVIKEVSKARKS